MESDFFDVSSHVFRAGKPIIFTVSGRFWQQSMAKFAKKGKLQLKGVPVCGYFNDNGNFSLDTFRIYEVTQRPDNPDVIQVELPPMDEGEFHCTLQLVCENKTPQNICEIKIYILNDDLFELNPYKGDMHVHSSYSFCGKRLDDPYHVAATAREKGLDFIAITDHVQIEGSEAVKDFSKKFNTEFQLYPGEECHVLKEKMDTRFCKNHFYSNVHIVNFGGNEGVIRYANEHYDEFYREVSERAEKINMPYPEDMRFIMAGADWICDKIHEFGGIAIFCHPAWRKEYHDNLSYIIRDYIAEQGKFDVMEVAGLSCPADSPSRLDFTESINLAAAWHQDLCIRKGSYIPVVGNTDSHNAEKVLGRHFTIVFCRENSFESISDALKKGLAVGVTTSDIPNAAPQIYGEYRLVRYAHFLLRTYFKNHDELCAIEGKMMRSALRNEITADKIRLINNNNIQNLITKFFKQ